MFEHAEHNKWILGKKPVATEYRRGISDILTDASAKGFEVPPADAISKINDIGRETKIRLTEINSLLYKEQTGIIFTILEFEAMQILEYDRLEMALHIQALVNALTLEQATVDDDFRKSKTDIARLNADVEKRSYDIAIGKADIESQLIDCRMREVEAARLGLDKELELIAAQMETAEERLKIIDYLNQLINKERIIVDLELRRAVILQEIIAVETEIAAIKEGMLPLYADKADAKVLQADAITEEVKWKKALAELGLDRIALKDAEAAADVTVKEKEAVIENYRLTLDRSTHNLTRLKSEYQVLLTEYGTDIAGQVVDIENAVKKAALELRLDVANMRLATDYGNEITLADTKIENLAEDIQSTFNKIIGVARAFKKSVRTSISATESVTKRKSAIAQAISSG